MPGLDQGASGCMSQHLHGADLEEGLQGIEFVPMLDEAAIGNPPDVDRAHQPVGWVEPLRNPSHVAVVTMGFASLNPSYKLLQTTDVCGTGIT
jgi:hypothetical protein